MALRLKGSSSGYAEIDASDHAGSVTLTLPATAGTINVKDASGNTNVGTGVNLGNPGPNIFTINTNGSERFRIAADGGVSIPGVLTYEDVTSVDAIGLSTFREGLNTKDVGITTISSTNINGDSVTAVDVFVYDTSKDSDGGAWRKRTKHTSWYNEAASATRGSRKEFPSVAVIVAAASQITIYDGDDPDLPLWMAFTWSGTGNSALGYDNRAKNAVTMSNGQLVTSSDPDGVHIARFVHDDVIRYTHTGYFRTTNAIAERTGVPHTTINTTDVLIASTCNDVAMTVLPNATIDDVSGLPVPTIAVATDSGISVIKDNGTVVDMYPTGSSVTPVNEIYFTESNNIAFTHNAYWVYHYKIPSTDTSATYWNQLSGFIGRFTDNTRVWDTNYEGIPINVGSNGITNFLEDRAIGHTNGLDIIDINEGGLLGYGMHAGISTDFNTGYQQGDIKGAYLSDTDTTNAAASTNLATGFTRRIATGAPSRVTSDTYDNGDVSWQVVDDPANPTNGFTNLWLNGTEAGKQYVITLTLDNNPTSTNPFVYHTASATQDTFSWWNGSGAGTLSALYTSQNSVDESETQGDYFTIYVGPSATINITNFSVREATEKDRSVNNKRLAVYGTVTKSAVATGAELVSYSGFSGSDYLVQPHNSDLAPGTGAYSVSCWFKTSTSGSNDQYIFDRGTSGSASRNLMLIMQTSGRIQFYHTNSSGTASDLQTTDMPSFADNSWHQVVGLYDGSAYRVYVDGIASTVTNTTGRDVGNDGGPQLTIGTRFNYTQTFGGDLALFRYSRSAPSPEQIKKMYEDEKVLFQENAKATLYGSSDAVTALAYDELTDQLHVGTSSGRSDFQGLRRINNTTTAVTTAISAHDTFIIEQ